MINITSMNDCSCWPKCFLTEHRHIRSHTSHNRWNIEIASTFQLFATKQYPCSHLDRRLNLLIESITQVLTCKRPNLGLVVKWVTHTQIRYSLNKPTLKFLGNRLNNDKTLGCNTALPDVLETCRR